VCGLHGEPGVGTATEGHVDSYCQVSRDRCSAVADICKDLFVNLQMLRSLGDREIEFSKGSPGAASVLDGAGPSSTPSGGGLKSLDVTS